MSQISIPGGPWLNLPTKLGNRFTQYIFENRLKIGSDPPTYLAYLISIRAGPENSSTGSIQSFSQPSDSAASPEPAQKIVNFLPGQKTIAPFSLDGCLALARSRRVLASWSPRWSTDDATGNAGAS